MAVTMNDEGCNYEYDETKKLFFIGKELPVGNRVDSKYCDFASQTYWKRYDYYKDSTGNGYYYKPRYPTDAWPEKIRNQFSIKAGVDPICFTRDGITGTRGGYVDGVYDYNIEYHDDDGSILYDADDRPKIRTW